MVSLAQMIFYLYYLGDLVYKVNKKVQEPITDQMLLSMHKYFYSRRLCLVGLVLAPDWSLIS